VRKGRGGAKVLGCCSGGSVGGEKDYRGDPASRGGGEGRGTPDLCEERRGRRGQQRIYTGNSGETRQRGRGPWVRARGRQRGRGRGRNGGRGR
jgi:hypothetical protein